MGNCFASRRVVSWADDGEWAGSQSPARVEDGGKRKGVEVKIRISRRRLQELLEKAVGGGSEEEELRLEKVLLEDIVNAGEVVDRRHHRHWKPALQSIPEVVEP